MDSAHLPFANRHLSWFLWLFATPVVSAPEKERKSFLRVGVAKVNFFCFAIEKKSPPQNNGCKVEFILVFGERVDCSKKNNWIKVYRIHHLSDLKTPHELPARFLMPWFKLDPISWKKPAGPAYRKIRTFRGDCWPNTAHRRSVSLGDNW